MRKFSVVGNDGKSSVTRPPLQELNHKHTEKTVKYGGSSVMVGFYKVRLKCIVYRAILYERLNGDYADNVPFPWVFFSRIMTLSTADRSLRTG